MLYSQNPLLCSKRNQLTNLDPSTPNAAKIKSILKDFENITLAPWDEPGNRLARQYYDNLPLPWTISPPVTAFPQSLFVKHEYDRNDTFTNGTDFYFGGQPMALAHVEIGLATTSPVKRVC